MRVLLVEDNAGDARLLEFMLLEALPEYTLAKAASLQEAIALLVVSGLDGCP